MNAKFWQAVRHARGLADFAYNLNMLLKSKFSLRSFWLFWVFFEVVLTPAIVPWVLLSNPLTRYYISAGYITPTEDILSEMQAFLIFQFLGVGNLIPYFTFEIVKRRSNKNLFGS